MAKNDFQYGGWTYYTLQCGTWHWDHDTEFARWQHTAMWHVVLGSWHSIHQVAVGLYPAKWHVAVGWRVIECARWQHPAMWLWNHDSEFTRGSTLQRYCDDMPLNSTGDSCNVTLWDHDTEFARWQHPAMWQLALESWQWILNPATWQWLWDDMPLNSPKCPPYCNSTYSFDFDHITAVNVILYQSAKFSPNPTTHGRKISRHVDFQDGGCILGVQ